MGRLSTCLWCVNNTQYRSLPQVRWGVFEGVKGNTCRDCIRMRGVQSEVLRDTSKTVHPANILNTRIVRYIHQYKTYMIPKLLPVLDIATCLVPVIDMATCLVPVLDMATCLVPVLDMATCLVPVLDMATCLVPVLDIATCLVPVLGYLSGTCVRYSYLSGTWLPVWYLCKIWLPVWYLC